MITTASPEPMAGVVHVSPSDSTPKGIVKASFNQVSKRFGTGPESVLALEPISLDIAENAFVCLVGPSGCGKSTLLNILAGFETACRLVDPMRAGVWCFSRVRYLLG